MMNIKRVDSIRVGGRYRNRPECAWRQVMACNESKVTYIESGILTMFPLVMPLDQFEAWAIYEVVAVPIVYHGVYSNSV